MDSVRSFPSFYLITDPAHTPHIDFIDLNKCLIKTTTAVATSNYVTGFQQTCLL